MKSVVADPGISPDGGMWDTRPAWMRFMARYVVKFLTKSPEQAAGCSAHVASVPIAELEGGGYATPQTTLFAKTRSILLGHRLRAAEISAQTMPNSIGLVRCGAVLDHSIFMLTRAIFA